MYVESVVTDHERCQTAQAQSVITENMCEQCGEYPKFGRHKVCYRCWQEKSTRPRCSKPGCDKPVTARGLCGTHYYYARQAGTLPDDWVRPVYTKPKKACKTQGCPNNAHAKGYCQTCYTKFVARSDDAPRCSVDDCDRPAEARGMCATHYAKWRRTNHRDKPPCMITGCDKPNYAGGMCSGHYSQARLYDLSGSDLQLRLSVGCWVCGSFENLTIDHDHDTGQVRGTLCQNHNLAVGHCHNRYQEAEAVAAYLRQWQQIPEGIPGSSTD